jgi:large subunit ribosomal protein L6
MKVIEAVKSVEVPSDVEVELDRNVVTVKGEKGEITRDFSHAPVNIMLGKNLVTVNAKWPRKKELALVGTICSHIGNMITGVTKGFTYKLKIVFSHFPLSVNVKERTVEIENFTGERSPRVARIFGDVKVLVKGEDVLVQGINIEEVSQTAANIQRKTKIKRKDPRVFLDGVYVYEKLEGMEE